MTTILRSTEYCDILKEAKIESEDSVSTIEVIRVKKLDREEIRFAYYKWDKKGKFNIVPRPLDLESHELLKLFKEAIKSKVFSDEFKKELKEML